MIALLIFISLLSFPLTLFVQRPHTPEFAIVRGQVVTEGKLRLSADLTLNCGGQKTRVSTDKKGMFSVTVQPGLCEVDTLLNNYSAYKRAPFRALPGQVAQVKVPLYFRYRLIVNYTDTQSGEMKDKAIPATPKYEERIDLPGAKAEGLYVRIIYETKQQRKNSSLYQNAVFTFDKVMIQANETLYRKRAKKFIFTGDCEIDQAEQVLNTDIVYFDGKNKKLSYK